MGLLKKAIQQAAAEMGCECQFLNTCAPRRIESTAQAKYHDTLRTEPGYTQGVHRAKATAKADAKNPAKKLRNISEKTYLTALVNMFCVGYPGACFRPLTFAERQHVFDVLIGHGWLNEHCQVTIAGREYIKEHNLLPLCQH